MSLTKMKTLLTALLLLFVAAQWNTASAQLSQMRLFSPTRSDQFGGGGHLREGIFAEGTFNWWFISKGRDQNIGWVNPAGQQNMYLSGAGGGLMPRINTISTNALDGSFASGTTIRLGNIAKHHGVEIKATFTNPQKDSFWGINGSMDIQDDTLSSKIFVAPLAGFDSYYYDQSVTGTIVPMTTAPGYIAGMGASSGYFWGWSPINPAFVAPIAPSAGDAYALAPLPITFDRYRIDSKISHWDLEANYIFRTHAALGGFFEFTGGARYLQLDDNLTFTGWGLPWRGNDVLISLIDPTPAYGGGGGGGGAGGTTTVDVTEYYLQQSVLPNTNRNYLITGTPTGPGTVLADSIWDFKADNHMVGPQIGIRYIKKFSGRWSVIADTKYFAGFNAQSIKSEGVMGSRTPGYDSGMAIDTIGTIPWVPVGTAQNPGMFRYYETRSEFSSVIDFSLKANWRLSEAIAFNLGYQGMFLDRTARASLVNDYKVNAVGNIFGINKNVNQSTWIHGLTAEVSLGRY